MHSFFPSDHRQKNDDNPQLPAGILHSFGPLQLFKVCLQRPEDSRGFRMGLWKVYFGASPLKEPMRKMMIRHGAVLVGDLSRFRFLSCDENEFANLTLQIFHAAFVMPRILTIESDSKSLSASPDILRRVVQHLNIRCRHGPSVQLLESMWYPWGGQGEPFILEDCRKWHRKSYCQLSSQACSLVSLTIHFFRGRDTISLAA